MTADPHTLLLQEGERSALARDLETLPRFTVEELDGRLLDDVCARRTCLPERMTQTLQDFAQRSSSSGALLLRGLPTDDRLPDTPRDGRPSPAKSSRVSESLLVLAGAVLGTVIGYREEKEGMVVHDVCPVPGREARQENSGSEYFEVHTENAFHPFAPDHVLLICLRDDAGRTARTLVSPARAALRQLPGGDEAVLRQPWFRHRMPTSFVAAGEDAAYSAPEPILTGAADDPQMRVDAFNTTGINPEAQAALGRFVAALRGGLDGWTLAPGDLLVVDNRRTVHARTGFTPRYDGRDRWLQRVFTVRDFARTRGVREGDSHVCGLPAGVRTA